MMKGLSGGERKRTAIGVELITNPSILFLDEPTSGLDSFTANKIVKLLVDQSRLGKTVISTIHQPSSDTFAKFDRLLLLMDGHAIYQGPAKDATQYFSKLGYECPRYANPADYFLKEFYVPYKKQEEDIEKLNTLVEGYDKYQKDKVAQENEAIKLDEVNDDMLSSTFHSISYFKELWLLTVRTSKNLIRNPQTSKVRIIQTVVIGVLIILVFWDMGNDEQGITGKAGFAFFISINQVMTALFSVLLTFLMERPVFLREYASRMYGVMSYFTSKSIVEIPFQALMPFLLACAVYFAVGFTADAGRFFLFALILVLDVFCATSIGFFIGCAVTNASAATSLVTLIMLPFILFAGFFVNLGDVYVWLRWLQYLSPIRYSTEAILRNEFEDNSEYAGKNTYERYHYDLGLGVCILILAIQAVVFRILALLFLKWKVAKVQ